MIGISVIIIAYNQSDLLATCLSSVKNLASEIIVIDLESTEDLSGIVKKYGGKLIKHARVQVVEEIRQTVLKYAKYDYILFLDPDETIPNTLAQEFKRLLKSGNIDYFETPRQNYVFGAWVKESRWWPDYQVRLFKKNKVTWPARLHAQPELNGSAHHFAPVVEYAIRHQNYMSLDEWFEKNRRYAKSDAANRLKSGENFSLMLAMHASVSEFVSRYFAGSGIADGMRGLILAILQSFYYFLVYAYYWEGKKYQELESEVALRSFPRSWFSHGLSEILHWDNKEGSFAKKIKSKFVRKLLA